MNYSRCSLRRLAVSVSFVLVLTSIAPGVTHAANRFWRGSLSGSNQYENTDNWSTTMGGDPGAAVPTTSDEVYFMNNLSGATLVGKNVWIKSVADTNGIVINQNMTGTILLGTGSLTAKWNGIRMGGGSLIGGSNSEKVGVRGSFTQTGGTVRMAGTLTVSGSVAITGTSTAFTSTGTVVFDGGNQNLNAVYRASFKNITVANTGSLTLLSDVSAVTGTLQINTGATLNVSTYKVYGTGATFINYGTLTEGTGGMFKKAATSLLSTDSTYAEEDDAFTTGDTLYITITDQDENIDGTTRDTLTVTVTAAAGDSETVTLTESTKTSGVFRGSVSTLYQQNSGADSPNNSYIETHETTTLTIAYTDAQDGGTNSDTATLTASSTTTAAATTSTGNAGGGRRSSGGGTSTVKTSPATVTAPARSTTDTATSLQQRVEARKQARVAKMLQRAAERAAKRKAARGL